MEHCPICNSPVIDYVGVQDATFDFQGPFSDIWRCCDCGYRWEEPWIDPEDTQEMRFPLLPNHSIPEDYDTGLLDMRQPYKAKDEDKE